MELPEELDAELKEAVSHEGDGPLDLSGHLSFSYDDGAGTTRTWTLERYDMKEGNTSIGDGEYDGKYIYRIVPAEGQDPVRLQFTDEEGNTTTSDDFQIELEDLYQEYEMAIYSGALDPSRLQAVIDFGNGDEREYILNAEGATLTIRGVVDKEDEDVTTAIITSDPSESVGNLTAQVPADTRFFINESPLEVADWGAVELLADSIVPAAEDILLVRTYDDFPVLGEDYKHEFCYLDLVDTSNGNVWVTADNPVTVYWPYPEGTDKGTEFYVVHYEGLDREFDEDLSSKEYQTTLFSATLAEGVELLENTDYGIKFTVDSFSPFALFWKEPAPVDPDDPDDPVVPNPDPDDPDPDPDDPGQDSDPEPDPDDPVDPDDPEPGPDDPGDPTVPTDPDRPDVPVEPDDPGDGAIPQTGERGGVGFAQLVAALDGGSLALLAGRAYVRGIAEGRR